MPYHLTYDEAKCLAHEINARPGWQADEEPVKQHYGGDDIWRLAITYTPEGFLTPWLRESITSRQAWEQIRDREEQMAAERKSAAMNCNFAIQYWQPERSWVAGKQEAHWVTVAYVPSRQYGILIGQWLHTTAVVAVSERADVPGTKVRVVRIHGMGKYGDILDVWPNTLDCGTAIWPCKHTVKERDK